MSFEKKTNHKPNSKRLLESIVLVWCSWDFNRGHGAVILVELMGPRILKTDRVAGGRCQTVPVISIHLKKVQKKDVKEKPVTGLQSEEGCPFFGSPWVGKIRLFPVILLMLQKSCKLTVEVGSFYPIIYIQGFVTSFRWFLRISSNSLVSLQSLCLDIPGVTDASSHWIAAVFHRTKTLYPRYAMNQFGFTSKKSNKRKHWKEQKTISLDSGR